MNAQQVSKLDGRNPAGAFGAAYELLLANLLLRRNGNPVSVVAITAVQEKAGASTIVVNLGLMAVKAGHRALLVDANLRTPSLHRAFGEPQSPGLAHVLVGHKQVAEVIRPTRVTNLDLVTAGESEVPPQSLLDPDRSCGTMTVLCGSRGYSFVIIDAAPILKYPDTLNFARIADGVVLVVPSRQTLPTVLQETRRRLERAEVRILGAVFNRVSMGDMTRLST